MTLTDAPDTAQASSEGDSQDSSEPPNGDRKQSVTTPRSLKTPHRNDLITPSTTDQKDSEQRPFANGNGNHTQHGPISPASPDHSTHFRESGNVASHRGLEPLVLPKSSIKVQPSCSTATSTSSSPLSSPTQSESNPWSPPPSRPPSQAPSRAPSMSGTKPDLSSLLPSSVFGLTKASKKERSAPVTPVEQSPAHRSKGPPSVHSADGGTKFNLKDLLGSAPKLTRKSSARSSASSRKSDSEGGPKSTAGESTGSFLQKYGTCERVAIGRGATSVVRLAHKWDRSEEKLYAVKVISF